MENIEKNEIINTEAIEDLTTEATSNNGSAIKTVGIIGLGDGWSNSADQVRCGSGCAQG